MVDKVSLCVLCPLMIGLMVVLLTQNYVALLQGSEATAGSHDRSWISCISFYRLTYLDWHNSVVVSMPEF